MDMVSDEDMEGGMKSLFIWPAIVLALGIWWSWGPRAETAPEVGTPPVPQVTLNTAPNVIQPVAQPAPPDPRAQPAGPGHWVWIPDKGPDVSYQIPAPMHH